MSDGWTFSWWVPVYSASTHQPTPVTTYTSHCERLLAAIAHTHTGHTVQPAQCIAFCHIKTAYECSVHGEYLYSHIPIHQFNMCWSSSGIASNNSKREHIFEENKIFWTPKRPKNVQNSNTGKKTLGSSVLALWLYFLLRPDVLDVLFGVPAWCSVWCCPCEMCWYCASLRTCVVLFLCEAYFW